MLTRLQALLEQAALETQYLIWGPPIPETVKEMIKSVRPHERIVLYRQPLQAAARLDWTAKQEGRSVERILADIRGEQTALGVIIDPDTHRCYGIA